MILFTPCPASRQLMSYACIQQKQIHNLEFSAGKRSTGYNEYWKQTIQPFARAHWSLLELLHQAKTSLLRRCHYQSQQQSEAKPVSTIFGFLDLQIHFMGSAFYILCNWRIYTGVVVEQLDRNIPVCYKWTCLYWHAEHLNLHETATFCWQILIATTGRSWTKYSSDCFKNSNYISRDTWYTEKKQWNEMKKFKRFKPSVYICTEYQTICIIFLDQLKQTTGTSAKFGSRDDLDRHQWEWATMPFRINLVANTKRVDQHRLSQLQQAN